MKPFYRVLTHTVLILQSFIILYLLSSHREDAQQHVDTCQSHCEANLYQGSGFYKLSTLLQLGSDSIKTLLPNVTGQWNRALIE